MPILSPSNELFDDLILCLGFTLSVKKASKESATKSLEILNKHIYLNINHKKKRRQIFILKSPKRVFAFMLKQGVMWPFSI
jgi:spermidine/putrescine-binding protein